VSAQRPCASAKPAPARLGVFGTERTRVLSALCRGCRQTTDDQRLGPTAPIFCSQRHTGQVMLPGGRLFGACIVGVALLLVAGCSSGGGKHASSTTTTVLTVPTNGPTTKATSPRDISPNLGLVGVPTRSLACPRHLTAMTATAALSGSVEEFVLCQVDTVQPETPTVVSAGDPQFTLLAKALAQPSQPLGHGPCPQYGDAPYVVLVKTPHGVYRVRVPTDACGHYFPDESIAFNQGRASGPDGPTG
jgi:hypothetical protein